MMGMEQYMGYRHPLLGKEPEERALPLCSIDGTVFSFDIRHNEFWQTDQPSNRFSVATQEEMGFSQFLYDSKTRNIFLGSTTEAGRLPAHVYQVIVPPLKDLDPVGLARRQGLRDNYFKSIRFKDSPLVLAVFRKTESRRKKKGIGI